MAKKPAGVTVEQLAALLNVDKRRVQQLAKEGVLKKLAHGRYDPEESVLAYVRYLQECVARRGGERDPEKLDQKERLIRLTADVKEIEKARLLRELVPLEEFRAALADITNRLAGKLRNVESTYAHRIIGVNDPGLARSVLREIAAELAAELRKVDLDEPDASAA